MSRLMKPLCPLVEAFLPLERRPLDQHSIEHRDRKQKLCQVTRLNEGSWFFLPANQSDQNSSKHSSQTGLFCPLAAYDQHSLDVRRPDQDRVKPQANNVHERGDHDEGKHKLFILCCVFSE
ncbi:uncharacterized protein RBU33_000760 [Hipposideros larvatus]